MLPITREPTEYETGTKYKTRGFRDFKKRTNKNRTKKVTHKNYKTLYGRNILLARKLGASFLAIIGPGIQLSHNQQKIGTK